MNRHRFDLIAAALGVVAIAVGLLVATASVDNIDADAGWWFAVAALVLGIALVPWSRRGPASADIDEVPDDIDDIDITASASDAD
ncbi:MAG TPA: hypothetical protein VGK49_00705 [Ilumatobacteraceae bacterium]